MGVESRGMKLWDNIKGRFGRRNEPSPVAPPPTPPEDPAAVNEREKRIDAENKHVELLDTGEDDPNRYTTP